MVAATPENDADRLVQRFYSPLVTCFGYTAQAACDKNWASDQCAWVQTASSPECIYQGQNDALYATISGSCATNPLGTTCQWGIAMNEANQKCGTATSKARCNSDQSGVWYREKCTKSYFGGFPILAKLGSKLAVAALAQDATCQKLSNLQACVADPTNAKNTGSRLGQSFSTVVLVLVLSCWSLL